MPNLNKKPAKLKVDTNVAPGNTAATAREPVSLDEVAQHLERLQGVYTVAAKLFALLVGQITIVSSTAPVQKGRKNVRPHPTPVS
jgi:hypothetical protein